MPKSSILQAIRGLAAVAVVLCHLRHLLDPASLETRLFEHFNLAVDVFFVISGFVIAVSTATKDKSYALSFIIRRLFRIIPLAWAVIILFALILHVDAGLLVRGFLLWPENPSYNIMPLNFPQWTLSYEFFFYMIFSLSIAISHKYRCNICLLMIAMICIGDWIVPQSSDPIRSFFRSDLFLEFASGVVLAQYIMRIRRSASPRLAIAGGFTLTLAGTLTCALRPLESGFFDFGIGAALTLAGLLTVEAFGRIAIPAWLNTLGELSYAIYISQAFAVLYVDSHVFWTPLYRTWIYQHSAGGSRLVLIFVVTLAIAALLHVVVEKPGIRLGRRLADGLRRT